MKKRIVFMAWLALGLTLLLSSCGDDHRETPTSLTENLQTSLKISLEFLSPMVQGDYAVRVTIAAADSPDTIINERSLTLVEAHSQTHNVTIDEIPVGNRRTVTVEIFKAEERLFQGVDTIDITLSGANQLSFKVEKVHPDAVTSDPSIPPVDATTSDLPILPIDATVVKPPPAIADVQREATQLYWPNGQKIQRANLDGSNFENLVIGNRATSIALDVVEHNLYWTSSPEQVRENGVGKILRADFDGSNIETLVTGIDLPGGIALDLANGKMYWIDEFPNKIKCANLDGSNVEILPPKPPKASSFVGIALNVVSGKMYWTTVGVGDIQSANLDGSGIETLVEGLDHPWDIALDMAGSKMYWADPGTGKIQRANLDGSNVEDLVAGVDPWGIALDMAGGKIYWPNRTEQKIQRANLDGSNIQDFVVEVVEAFDVDSDAF